MNHAIDTEGGATRFYEGQIPWFAEFALDRLYGALYSSLPLLSLGSLNGVSTWAASDGGQLRALFLHLRKGPELRVINEGMSIEAGDAETFAQACFSRDARIDRVRFHAVRLIGRPATLPAWQAPVTEDIVIDLPKDETAYIASLGKATRKTLRQNLNRAGKLTHVVVPGTEVDASLITAIIGFNHARMAGKQRASALDTRAGAQLLALVRARGMVGTVSLAGTLCAGTLACRFGDDVYSLVNAHDPALDPLGMGNLSRHLMILATIRAGARRFHLLGGHFTSKRSCGARRVMLDDVTLYRSRFAMLADAANIAVMAWQSANYRLRVAIEAGNAERQSGLAMRAAKEAMQALRRLKAAQH